MSAGSYIEDFKETSSMQSRIYPFKMTNTKHFLSPIQMNPMIIQRMRNWEYNDNDILDNLYNDFSNKFKNWKHKKVSLYSWTYKLIVF